jgi:prepilin-type N-terminal cleavage/methylation domain-containing protein
MSTTKPKAPVGRSQAAFTVLELMVAMAIGSLLMAAVMALGLYAGRTMAAIVNYIDLNASSVNAGDQLTRDIRQSVRLTSFSTNSIVLDDGTNGPLTFSFSGGKLLRNQGSKTKTLLTGVNYGEFAMYQRTTISNSYNQYAATDTASCKALLVKWNCSRIIFGSTVNTESGKTKRIVIRKS